MTNLQHESRVWRNLRRSRAAWMGAVIVALYLFVALTAGMLAPYPPKAFVADTELPPSAAHPLGTDSVGRDVLSRVLYGTRLSLAAGVISIAMAVAIGVPIGAVAGYRGGWSDTILMRGVDVLLSFPGVLVAMLVVVALSPGWPAVIFAVGLINVPIFARQVRATVVSVRSLDYVVASRAAGATPAYILTRVISPALVSPIVVLGTLGLATAILEVAGLSFLGISGQPDEPEWGYMLQAARSGLSKSIWPALAPGVAISLAVLGFNLLGDGLRDALDPHLVRRGGPQ
ncbi:MAG: ABC transporter permease [Pirellulales bacterium]|nr:ABC transporter permease [Pirellulales bacterium]